jgi:hypothetical protein
MVIQPKLMRKYLRLLGEEMGKIAQEQYDLAIHS